jgi:hypothetical protein
LSVVVTAAMSDIATAQTCPYCTTPVVDGQVWTCEECGARHHAECWDDNRGCAVALCTAGPEGSDPSLRPPVSAPRVLVVDLEPIDDPTPRPREGARSALRRPPAPAAGLDRDQRRALIWLLAGVGGLLVGLLIIMVVTS